MRHLLTLSFLVVAFYSSAQAIKSSIEENSKFLKHTLTWAMREKSEFRDGDNIIQIENTGSNLAQFAYTAKLSGQKHALIIHKFDDKGNETATNKLDKGEREFGPVPTVSLEFNNRLLLFYFRYIDKDSMKLYVSEIDKKDLSLKNTQHLFSYLQENVGLFRMGTAVRSEIITRISPDSSKLFIAYNSSKNEMFTCVLSEIGSILRKKISRNLNTEDAEISDAFVENSGNSEIVLSKKGYTLSNNPVKGILVQRLDNQERFLEYSTIGVGSKPLNLHFKNSKDNSKLYLFGDYATDTYSDGVWIANLESQKFKINTPSVYPYPDDFKKRVYKIGFGDRKRSNYGVLGIDYELVEFENGDISLCGHPVLKHDGRYVDNGKSSGHILFFAGPIIVSFIEKNKTGNIFTMIPRNQNMSVGASGIYVPYHDKLIVFYNDYKKNINGEILEDDVQQSGGNIVKELSLGYAIIKKDGTIAERKLIVEGVSRMNCYNTNHSQWISDKKLLIPAASLEKKTDVLKVAAITIE